jgi:hypothetical protein
MFFKRSLSPQVKNKPHEATTRPFIIVPSMVLNSKVQGISYLVFNKDHRPYLSTSPSTRILLAAAQTGFHLPPLKGLRFRITYFYIERMRITKKTAQNYVALCKPQA